MRKLGRVATNVASNYVVRFSSMALGLAVTPLYVRLLGLEAYGLVGLYNSIQAVLAWLDVGVAPTLARSLARLSATEDPRASQEMRDLATTFGLLSCGIGLLAGAALALGAPLLTRWVNVSSLSVHTVIVAVVCMGLNAALQWPAAIFQGGIMALERQVASNAITLLASGARALLTIGLLLLLGPRIEHFFVGQAIGSGLTTASAWLVLFRVLPRSPRRGRFRKDLLLANWRFAAGMTGTTITTTVSTQVDTIVLTRVLTLRDFGTYSLAKLIANGLCGLTTALVNAFYPRYCRLAAGTSERELAAFYHLSSQAMFAISMSLCLACSVFAPELLLLWTRSPQTAVDAAPILRFLALGAAVQSILALPYYLQLAHGWTSLSIWMNVVNLVLSAPITVWSSVHFGATGAAAAGIFYNVMYACLYMPLMHRRLLCGELSAWLTRDVLFPMLGALGPVLGVRMLFSTPSGWWAMASMFAGTMCLALLLSSVSGARVRQQLWLRLGGSKVPANP